MKTIQQEFFRYLIVGGIAFLADFSMLATLSSGMGIHYLMATLIAFVFGIWVNYTLSVRWVFMHRTINNKNTEFSLFLLVGVLTLGLSMICMSVLVEWLGIHHLLAKCITTGLTLVTNFAGRRILLFGRPNQTQPVLVSSVQ